MISFYHKPHDLSQSREAAKFLFEYSSLILRISENYLMFLRNQMIFSDNNSAISASWQSLREKTGFDMFFYKLPGMKLKKLF